MTTVLLGLVFVLIVAAVVLVGAFALGAKRVGANATSDLQLVPGVERQAPANWFGSHDPEAVLYRRLVAAVRGVQAAGARQGGAAEVQASIEIQALEIEKQLVAVSRMAAPLKGDVLPKLEDTVGHVERVCAEAVTHGTGIGTSTIDGELEQVSERLRLIREAHRELGGQGPDAFPF